MLAYHSQTELINLIDMALQKFLLISDLSITDHEGIILLLCPCDVSSELPMLFILSDKLLHT